jgi:hypothetical protein
MSDLRRWQLAVHSLLFLALSVQCGDAGTQEWRSATFDVEHCALPFFIMCIAI